MKRLIPFKIEITDEHDLLYKEVIEGLFRERKLGDVIVAALKVYQENEGYREEVTEKLKEIYPLKYAKNEYDRIEENHYRGITEGEIFEEEMKQKIRQYTNKIKEYTKEEEKQKELTTTKKEEG